ncbi:MAG: molecular chaperone DnaK [Desulfuromonadaceae bacterium GWB2_53_15]|nr:MAG: molecular chaperone DnaK [Desulfuromonadaceae bacterium GWB2_53_15]
MPQADEKRQTRLKTLLFNEKRQLWNELRTELFEKLGEGLHTQYDIPQDIGEQGMLALLEDTGLAVIDIRREQLTQMEEVLAKFEEGNYGICEDCGEEIDEARLRVAPYVPCCVSCQKQREGPASLPGLTL